MKQRILCSAIWVNDEKIYTHQPNNIDVGFVVCGRRHHNCISTLMLIFGDLETYIPIKKSGKIIQGFLTNDDKFVDRRDGYKIAKDADQIIHNELIGSILTSEDLW
jgi:hypothetical protein